MAEEEARRVGVPFEAPEGVWLGGGEVVAPVVAVSKGFGCGNGAEGYESFFPLAGLAVCRVGA